MELLKKLFKGDSGIWIVFFCLLVISLLEVFSASSTLTYKSGDHWGPVTQHSIYLMVGTAIVMAVHNIPCKYFRHVPIVLLPVSFAMLLIVTITGALTNGAKRWMDIFGIQFQPSELAKMGVVLGVALILSKVQTEKGASPKAFRWIMLISLFICGLIFRENGSTAILLFGVVFMMMIIGRVPWRQWIRVVIVAVAGVVLLVGTMRFIPADTLSGISRRLPTMQSRINGFFEDKSAVSPQEYDIDKDAQVAHAHIAIARSHIIGRMPGNSVERDFLSQAFSDFIFAIILEELGLLGGAFVIFLYVMLLIRSAWIARRSPSLYPALLVMGVTLLLVSQAVMNMCVAVGLFPVTGQPLPLVSKGGTSTFINCCYIGMILSVSRYVNYKEERAKMEKKMIEASPSEAKAIEAKLEETRHDELEDEE